MKIAHNSETYLLQHVFLFYRDMAGPYIWCPININLVCTSDVSSNNIGVSIFRALINVLTNNSRLRELDLSDNSTVLCRGWQDFFALLHNPNCALEKMIWGAMQPIMKTKGIIPLMTMSLALSHILLPTTGCWKNFYLLIWMLKKLNVDNEESPMLSVMGSNATWSQSSIANQ